jgi:hypothetical protein
LVRVLWKNKVLERYLVFIIMLHQSKIFSRHEKGFSEHEFGFPKIALDF